MWIEWFVINATCKILSNDKETCSMCLKPFKKKLENSRTLKLALKLFLVLHDWEIFSMLIFDEIWEPTVHFFQKSYNWSFMAILISYYSFFVKKQQRSVGSILANWFKNIGISIKNATFRIVLFSNKSFWFNAFTFLRLDYLLSLEQQLRL